MAKQFTHDAVCLLDFFSQSGRGFYIPYYQRNYSWDEENATKLIGDIFSGTKQAITKQDHSIFLGTVILHEEKSVQTGVHLDTPNLITKVVNVVDGQQRITSISMLACVLAEKISETVSNLKSFTNESAIVDTLATELTDELPNIRKFYSVKISKTGVKPPIKPKIIRAGDAAATPVSDQWTLNGDINVFYRSNTSVFLSQFISGKTIENIETDERVKSVLDAFGMEIEKETQNADRLLACKLLTSNTITNSNLQNFMAYPPSIQDIDNLSHEAQSIYYSGMLLLAFCSFLKNSCHLVVIDCLDLGLAFDMFQSLNATGTPLTAFEVFKPQIVKTWCKDYSTKIKPQVNRIEAVFETENNSSNKEETTDKVIVSSALTFNGKVLSRRFSEERDWLKDTLLNALSKTGTPTDNATKFITTIADQAEYFSNFVKPRKSPKNSNSFKLCTHLTSLGLTQQQADISALCVFYLKDAGHQFAHTVISVFYAKLLRAQSQQNEKTSAASAFVDICKATAAFFTLYMGAQQSRFPDSDYRNLFQDQNSNITFESGCNNQTISFVKTAFRKALENQGIYNIDNVNDSRQRWVSLAKETAWYSRKTMCRFALFVSAHNAAPDIEIGKEGLYTNGKRNSADFLNCRAWHSSDYEVIEHIATRQQPSSIKFPNHFDENIYPGNYSIVDKIGNLTLLSNQVNASIYSEWPDKVFYYWNLTTPMATAAGQTGKSLAKSLGIESVPPALTSLVAASNYLSHLAPLALRGQAGLKWDADFIAERSEHLCQRVFDKLDAWLR